MPGSSLANTIIEFYLQMKPLAKLPDGIEVLFPHAQKEVQKIIKTFYSKFYSSNKMRGLIFGINPGRLGAGITGINFTAPRQLSNQCGINHSFKDSSELSAEFIYDMIDAYGGPAVFYNDWFITPVCQLGFVRNGKNINYYDDKDLQEAVTPFIVQHIKAVLSMGFNQQHCFCIGEDKNYKFLSSINEKYKWFKQITPLPHPRFILQYRRKEKQQYIDQYIKALTHQN